MSKSVAPQLGFGLRQYLQQLIHEALVTLTARCANSPRKEATHLRRVLHDWQSFYTKVVVNNGIKGILQSSSVQNTAFCEILLLATGEDDAPSIDAKEAASILFTSLGRLLCEDGAAKTEVINFVGDFLVRIRLMLSGGRSTAASRAAMHFVDALAGSALVSLVVNFIFHHEVAQPLSIQAHLGFHPGVSILGSAGLPMLNRFKRKYSLLIIGNLVIQLCNWSVYLILPMHNTRLDI